VDFKERWIFAIRASDHPYPTTGHAGGFNKDHLAAGLGPCYTYGYTSLLSKICFKQKVLKFQNIFIVSGIDNSLDFRYLVLKQYLKK